MSRMFNRLRRLHLSLATKCQLLFGVAAGVIILAALAVAWQRIEQLTVQQDRAAAETLAKQALAAHARDAAAGTDSNPPPGTIAYDDALVRRPQLTGVGGGDLTPFERRALDAFADAPGRQFLADAAVLPRAGGVEDDDDDEGVPGLRLAMAARAAGDCRACHAAPGFDLDVATAGTPAPPPLIGLVSVELPSQVSPRQRLLNRGFLITAALLAATTAAATLYVILTRLILNPVRVLQETAEAVRGGELNVRAEIASGDEFETLGRTLNAMVAGLQDRNDALAKANRSLDDRLGRLAEANTALDESNRLKSEFLANVSHELRTPLNSILGFADLLKSEAAADAAKRGRYAGNIAKSGQSLLDLINDLLDLAKIEAGRMEVRRGSISVRDVFESLSTLLGPLAGRRGVRIVSEVGGGVPVIETDGGKLQQILYNLLSNAIKFSPEGGRIDLVARREQGEADADFVRISVTDQGPGVAAADQSRIFEKFRQLDAGVTREHAGTGLGLSISRELATLLGGTLTVESRPGEGATFRLRLPVAPRGASF